MEPTKQHILTINGGSSSIKFALFEVGSVQRILQGKIERIGSPGTILHVKGIEQVDNFSKTVEAPSHTEAISILLGWIKDRNIQNTLSSIGHRLVHGGPKHYKPEKVTAKMIQSLQEFIPFDPEHLPEELLLIEAFHHEFPDIPQIACFDTAFHHDLPREAKMLPIPRHYEAKGVRRYGFHGLSYEYLMEELSRLAGPEAGRSKVILAHLGNGASLAAVHDGKCMDTSMGFTPGGGVPMSTRSGDLDPGLFLYLASTEGLDAKKISKLVNCHSGLLGISETSSDMHDLLKNEKEKDIRSAEAIALFCYHIKKSIGAFAAALGGLDTIIFSGGIGENAPSIRSRICSNLEFLGIELEEKRNSTNAGLISSTTSQVEIRVIATDEEFIIAKTVCLVLNLMQKKEPSL